MKVMTNAAWLSACRIAADVLSFVLFAVISRELGPSGTGEYSYAFALASLVALICTAGFDEYGIRQYVRSSADERRGFWRALMLTQTLQLAFGLAVLSIFLLMGGAHESHVSVVLYLTVYLVGWGLSRTLFIPAMGSQEMVGPAIIELSCRLIAILLALFIAMATNLHSLSALLVGFPLGAIVLVALGLRNSRQHGCSTKISHRLQDARATWRNTMPFAASEIMNQFYARTDLLLIAYMLGSVKVGFYATAIKFVEVGLLPLVTFGSAVYPALTHHAATQETKFRQASIEYVSIVMFLAGWLAIGISYVVPLLVPLVFGEKFSPVNELLPWFGALAVMKGLEIATYRLLYASRKQNAYVTSLVVGTGCILALNLLLIPLYGLHGAVLAAITSIALVDTVCIIYLRKSVGLRVLGITFARTCAALALTVGLAETMYFAALPSFVIAALAAIGFPLAAFLCRLIKDPRHMLLFRP